MHLPTTLAIATVWLVGQTASSAAGGLPGSFRALEAVAICYSATSQSDRAAQDSLLDRGLALAQAAVEADDTDAAGHFAVFCNLGRRLQLHPLGLGSLGAIHRVRRAIDRALELAPGSPQVLTGKGIMLLQLPRLLGGDPGEGARLLRQALTVAPGFADAQRALAEIDGTARFAAAGP